MKIKVNKIHLKNILLKQLKYYLKIDIISFQTYNNFLKMIELYPDYHIKIYNNINKLNNKKIPLYNITHKNEPNFIILSSGQSNAGGWGSNYDQNSEIDQKNKNIFSYNTHLQKWVIADLENNSLGDKNLCRTPKRNLFVFQFAKHLINAYPGIKPGIINICDAAEPISSWTKFEENEDFYDEYLRTINYTETKKGYFVFENIKKNLQNAKLQLLHFSKKIFDVVIWHQGESDYITKSNKKYYEVALKKVIDQFSELNNNELTPFISGTLLDYYKKNFNSDPINNIIRNINNRFYAYAELSKLEATEDGMHFTTESTRIGGKLYFDTYQKLIQKFKKEGLDE